ncbi:MAG: hypothetical protein AAGA92_10020 [Planctomycetota bacterium]
MLQKLQGLLAPVMQAGLVESVVRQVADASVESVCSRVSDSARGMGLSETRGYIRARAGLVVRRQARLAVKHAGVHPSLESTVRRDATERLVPVVMRIMERERVGSLTLRAAA